MRSNYLVFGQPIIEQEEIDEIIHSLKSGWIGTGPKVAQFEADFKEYIGSKYAIAVSSCTAGLHLSVLAMGVNPGDEVIVPTMTFAATANAVVHTGANPIFVDVDKYEMTIDVEDIRKKITSKTKAIIPVHFAGRACNIKEIEKIASDHNLKIIHDAAHAVETEFEGKKIGCFRDIANFSFYVTKNITTAEGGMITTDDEEIAQKLKIYALHGMSKDAWKRFSDDGYKHYEVIYPGYKYNMTDMSAALGLSQLARVDEFNRARTELVMYYRKRLEGVDEILPLRDPSYPIKHSWHLFIVRLDIDKAGLSRDDFMQELKKRNIGTGLHFRAAHLQKYYREVMGMRRGMLPNTEWNSDRIVSLPLFPDMKECDVDDVVDAIKEVLKKG